MKKYTQEEFDAFQTEKYGYKHCPTGDYSEIKVFGDRCNFSENCRFGERCIFISGCTFGARCTFGGRCSFGAECVFGILCRFGEFCSFSSRCSFFERCWFGESCAFDKGCSFSERCWFERNCSCEFGAFKEMVACSGFGSTGRTTYFFNVVDKGICVRCDCFAGTLDKWRVEVVETQRDSNLARAYLKLAESVEIMFGNNV